MEAAAAVARALFQARRATFEVQTAPAPNATMMGAKTAGAVAAAGPAAFPVATTSATASPSISSSRSRSSVNLSSNRINNNLNNLNSNNTNNNSTNHGHVVEYLAPHDPADDRSRLVVHSWSSANPRRSSLIVPSHSGAPVAMPPALRRAPSSPVGSTSPNDSGNDTFSPRSPHGGYPDVSAMDRIRAAMAAATGAQANAAAAAAAQSSSRMRGTYTSKRLAGGPPEDDEASRFDRASIIGSSSTSSSRR